MLARWMVAGVLLVLGTGVGGWGQEGLSLAADYQMRIEGTSNVRKWDADITRLEADFILSAPSDDAQIALLGASIEKLVLRIAVEDIRSKTKGLTGKIHKYLKKDDQPDIVFELGQVTDVVPVEEGVLVTALGVVNAAGAEHEVTMEVGLVRDGEGRLLVSGSQALQMTSFAIKPPTAFFGAMRADDDIVVYFELTFGADGTP
ncbi:MAG: hypothetical protein GKR89_29225 [Candidatus Latescibacteria bacterium]|nr:hypothetical protein [Candidatus Latescibacterota bacterium]